MTPNRAFVIVMDSVGIGGARDAGAYQTGGVPDTGANTLAHIDAETPLTLPALARLGLWQAAKAATGWAHRDLDTTLDGFWAVGHERSRGKDTPSGHWELAGLPVPFDWHVFENDKPVFPRALSARVAQLAGTEGILGDCHASGTEIIAALGAEHLRTGWPICYTSADSVFQIAAHEDSFGLQKLLDLCAALAPELHAMRVGRVIARPFTGAPGSFTRTANRRDFALEPPGPTMLDIAFEAGHETLAIGKIGDIFSHRGITRTLKGPDDAALAEHLITQIETAPDGALVFANFVEFDSLYGHRRDIAGYARHLQWFDTIAARALAARRPDDLLIFTADHGNDPSWAGTDHTRETVPILCALPKHRAIAGGAGAVAFSDVAASVLDHLGLDGPIEGKSFLPPEL